MGLGQWVSYTANELREWIAFVHGLRERNRYVPTDEKYLASLIDGCLTSRKTLPAGTTLFRSRIMPLDRSLDDEPLDGDEMGPPPPEVATEGRLNPEGISCFYAALEEETAVAEVRPWSGARLSVAQFKILEDVELIDLTGGSGAWATDHKLRLRTLSVNVARPIHRKDRWGYLGTQYLAEALKARGVAGVNYHSALRADGNNVAMFSTENLNVEGVKLVEISSVSYDYETCPKE